MELDEFNSSLAGASSFVSLGLHLSYKHKIVPRTPQAGRDAGSPLMHSHSNNTN